MFTALNSKFDSPLLVVVLILLVVGVLIVYSASSFKAQELFKDSRHYVLKHIYKVMAGLLLMAIVMYTNYQKWLNLSWLLLAASFFALIYLLLAPNVPVIRGTKRWLTILGFQIQPADFARLALILFLSNSLGSKNSKLRTHEHSLMLYLAIIGLLTLPILLQPDIGTTAITVFIALVLLFLGGQKMHLLLLTGSAAAPLLLLYILRDGYAKDRFYQFLASIKGEHLAWQTKQSLIALGNGGILGLGLGEGRQKFHFLPDPFTDFIYAIVGEELGLIGTIGIVVLFMILIWRGFRIARNAPDSQGILLASGIVLNIAMYAFTNAGVVVNVLPTTGIPMPFLSYGGSALIVNLVGIGLLLNISAQARQKRRLYQPEALNNIRKHLDKYGF